MRFLNAARGGGVESQFLDFSTAYADDLPEGVDALVFTSDLQGVVPSWRHGGANALLGIEVADVLIDLSDEGKIPDPQRTGIILAGDLYSAPAGDKRGATGDVREVWEAFSVMHRWVVGVAGNHDCFGTAKDEARLQSVEKIDILDGDVVKRDGLDIGGVSYIVGNPQKAGRREEGEFFAALELVVEQSPDILVLHQGPQGTRTQRGDSYVRSTIESGKPGLVVCGHVHWDTPFAQLDSGVQVVNVDCRVLIVTRSDKQ